MNSSLSPPFSLLPLDDPRLHTFQIRRCRPLWLCLPSCHRSPGPGFARNHFSAFLPSTNERSMPWRWCHSIGIHQTPPCIFVAKLHRHDATSTTFHRNGILWSNPFLTNAVPCYHPCRADFCQPKTGETNVKRKNCNYICKYKRQLGKSRDSLIPILKTKRIYMSHIPMCIRFRIYHFLHQIRNLYHF